MAAIDWMIIILLYVFIPVYVVRDDLVVIQIR